LQDVPDLFYDVRMRTQRVRDPVHGLIVFDQGSALDQLAWKLIATPEFQRLRRIRQLGVSEFTFPGATHTRFSHSIGVFHTARELIRILKRLIPSAEFREHRANVAVLAALLHDLGHGPFSHAFEEVQKSHGASRDHEEWTAEIIRNERGSIRPLLNEPRSLADEIADLLRADNPQDIYHAVVSSSFDADRLDYLRRDRLMTGTGAGAIDFDWLLDNLRIARISTAADEDATDAHRVDTFCLDHKALQAAESFLLARYHLFQQVYLHKATRGFEQLITVILGHLADAATAGQPERIGLDAKDPLVRFYSPGGGTIENYIALDDYVVWCAVGRMVAGPDPEAAEHARRFRDRERLKALDIDALYPPKPHEKQARLDLRRAREMQRIERLLGAELGRSVWKDSAPISVYVRRGGRRRNPRPQAAFDPDERRLATRDHRCFADDRGSEGQAEPRPLLLRQRIDIQNGYRRAQMTKLDKLVAEAISIGGGEIIGRVRLQKIFYLLEQSGLQGGLRFEYHHYGPYSRGLDEALEKAKAFHGVREAIHHRDLDGMPYSVFTKRARVLPKRLGAIDSGSARDRIMRMKSETSTVLELAATIHWLSTQERVADWRTELRRRKGGKAEDGRTERALVLLVDLGLEPRGASAAP
jgi:HD superfamily phosphohydrolase/uncharacterized protein YwgA